MKPESHHKYLEHIRWPEKIRCAFCYSIVTSIPFYKNEWKVYRCPECKKDFTVLSNSPLEKSKLKPRQLCTLLHLIKHNKLTPPKKNIKRKFQGVPSALARKIGVHHWTMTKIMNRVKGKSPEELLNKPGIASVEEAFTHLFQGNDRENIPLAIFLCTYKFITDDPRGLSAISGCTPEFVAQAMERIKESWESGKEFEEDEYNWYDPESWNSETYLAHVLTLHCLCIQGEIKRNPITKKWSLKKDATPEPTVQNEPSVL